MPTDLPPIDPSRHARRTTLSDEALYLHASAGIPGVLVGLIVAMPGPLVLPMFAAIAGTASIVFSVGSSLRLPGLPSASDGLRDLTLVLALAGFGALMMTDYPEVMQVITGPGAESDHVPGQR